MTPQEWLLLVLCAIVGLMAGFIWHLVMLSRIEQRVQDLAMIVLAAQKPETLDEFCANRLKAASNRIWGRPGLTLVKIWDEPPPIKRDR